MSMERLVFLVSAMNTGGAETFLIKLYRKQEKTKYRMDFCVDHPKKRFYDDEIQPMGFYDLKVAKRSGAKKCIAISSNFSDGNRLKSKLAHRLGRILYEGNVDIKIVPSDLAAKFTFGKKEYKIGYVKILYNAIDLNYFRFSEKSRTDNRQKLRIPEDAFAVGHIDRFSEQKNRLFLFDIFACVAKKRPDAYPILVGDGERKEQIREKEQNLALESRVIFTGVRSDISALLSAFDVFLFPSFYEEMPNTVIEAQATGLPRLISDTITKEVNISGLVQHMPLTASPEQWTEKAMKCVSQEREDVKESFLREKYDIESVVEEFVRRCFLMWRELEKSRYRSFQEMY